MADYNNYGDEPEAVDLMYPATPLELGISEMDFQQMRDRRSRLRRIFYLSVNLLERILHLSHLLDRILHLSDLPKIFRLSDLPEIRIHLSDLLIRILLC